MPKTRVLGPRRHGGLGGRCTGGWSSAAGARSRAALAYSARRRPGSILTDNVPQVPNVPRSWPPGLLDKTPFLWLNEPMTYRAQDARYFYASSLPLPANLPAFDECLVMLR